MLTHSLVDLSVSVHSKLEEQKMKNKIIYTLVFFVSIAIILIMIFSDNTIKRNTPYPVKINNINIEVEVSGILSKSVIEFEFFNPNDTIATFKKGNPNKLKAIQTLYFNNDSFIKNMWLEVNNKYIQAKTFVKGEQNHRLPFEQVLLEKENSRTYQLRLFPFKAKERKKVKLEIYSVLEPLNNRFLWIFGTTNSSEISYSDFKCPINIKIKNNLHPKSSVKIVEQIDYFENIDVYRLLGLSIDDLSPDNLSTIEFSIPNEKKVNGYKLYDKEKELYFCKKKKSETNKRNLINEYLNDELYIIENLIKNTKNKIPTFFLNSIKSSHRANFVDRSYPLYNNFGYQLENYLIYKYNFDLTFNDAKYSWSRKKNQIEFGYRNDILLSSTKKTFKNISFNDSIPCHFLSNYFEYFKDSNKIFLTNNNLKVINNDFHSFDDENRYNYNKIKPSKNGIIDGFDWAPSDYISRPPEIIGDYEQLYSILKYPLKSKYKEGKAFVSFIINRHGSPENMKILSEFPKKSGFGEVALLGMKLCQFQPAIHNDNFVNSKIKMIIPFKKDACKNNYTKYFDKFFKIDFFEEKLMPIDKTFSPKRIIFLKYLSEEYFDFIYKNSDYVKYFYNFENIAINIDNKNYIVTSSNRENITNSDSSYILSSYNIPIIFPMFNVEYNEKIVPLLKLYPKSYADLTSKINKFDISEAKILKGRESFTEGLKERFSWDSPNKDINKKNRYYNDLLKRKDSIIISFDCLKNGDITNFKISSKGNDVDKWIYDIIEYYLNVKITLKPAIYRGTPIKSKIHKKLSYFLNESDNRNEN